MQSLQCLQPFDHFYTQICNGQGRYVSLTRVSGLAISLCGVEVFPEAANAAIAKNTTASRGGGEFASYCPQYCPQSNAGRRLLMSSPSSRCEHLAAPCWVTS